MVDDDKDRKIHFGFVTMVFALCIVLSLSSISDKLGRIADALDRAYPAAGKS